MFFKMKFNEKCYDICKKVPKGKVISYKQIVDKLKCKAYRAVGKAMKANKNKKIHCHRVICNNGFVGGYNKGVDKKIKLLRREGIKIVNGKIDMRKYKCDF